MYNQINFLFPTDKLRFKCTSLYFQLTSNTPDDNVPIKKVQNVVPLSEQIKQFSTIHYILTSSLGTELTKNFLAKSLFFISIGSNDILDYYHSNSQISKQEFMYALGSAYENHLKVRYYVLKFAKVVGSKSA